MSSIFRLRMGRKPFIKLAKLKNMKCGTQSPFLKVTDAARP